MTFAEFFRAVWGSGESPFPWQERLAELAIGGEWPRTIALPASSGETALIDIAVYALAMRARNAARRIFFVVDQRTYLHKAEEHATQLARKLAQADPASGVGRLIQELRELGGDPEPLMVARPNHFWTSSPIQPAVICTTVDDLGSSLLFRGYGSSEFTRPIRAGLASHDSLIIIDDVHDSKAFVETLDWLTRYREWASKPLQSPFTVVDVSTMPRQSGAFFESQSDRATPVLKRRWKTKKRARLVLEDGSHADDTGHCSFAKAMTREALRLKDEGDARIIGVIANDAAMARCIYNELNQQETGCVILLTCSARAWDRRRIWKEWKDRIGAGHSVAPDEPVFVVATGCIEAGPAIDFDALVTEIASIDELQSRFACLGRDGSASMRHAAIIAMKHQIARTYVDPVYGKALGQVWTWLKQRAREQESVGTQSGDRKRQNGSIAAEYVPMDVIGLREALANFAECESLRTPGGKAPVLLPAHLDLLCQTSPAPAISPEPGVFLHGEESAPPEVRVVWRQDLELGQQSSWDHIAAICPPDPDEAVALPLAVVRRWLANDVVRQFCDTATIGGEDVPGNGSMAPVLDWHAEESRILDRVEQIRPASTIMLPAKYGGYDEWGWDPKSKAEVADIGDAVKVERGQPVLRLHPHLANTWNYSEAALRFQAVRSVDEAQSLLAQLRVYSAAEWVGNACQALLRCGVKLVDDPRGGNFAAALIGRGSFEQEAHEACYGAEVPLDRHLAECARIAERFGRELPEMVRNTVVRAAELHDIGKADVRFQAWLRGGNAVKLEDLLAKSAKFGWNRRAVKSARERAHYPRGARHELTSVALLEVREADFTGVDFDLLLHLIASHHGRCRPFAPAVEDREPLAVAFGPCPSVHLEMRLFTWSDHRLDRAGSGVSERFWRLVRRYGWFGLSFLETVVRLADHAATELEFDGKSRAVEAQHA